MHPLRTIQTVINMIAQILVLAGALNWGLLAYTKINAVEALVPKAYQQTVYKAVGIAALYVILLRFL
jgi:uncharacterized membrane protein YuzA (DUF378 family)